ncbi:MAG TPA: hypothetical protein PLR06_14245 [Cyclobacteriaceae bacterium]|nr:hypothetical protein [Cyclobacteriaceae bacterium]
MKTTLTFIFFFFSVALMAQTTELPAKEFNLRLSEESMSIRPGESKSVTVSVLRSKSFAKGSVKLGTSSVLPQGITLQFEPAEGLIDTSAATIRIDPAVALGSYNIIINGDVYHKVKGTTLKLMVSNDALVVK